MGDEPRSEGRGEEGVSLVEVLVAMFLFGVVMVGLTAVFISSAQSVGDQRLRSAATRVATDHLERMRALPFGELDASAGQTTVIADGRAYAVNTQVTAIDAATGAASPVGRVKQITVTVSWTSAGSSRNVSYTTAVADEPRPTVVAQAIGTITMFPNPATTDALGRPLQDIDVTVPLSGFPVSTLVNLSWTNSDGTAGAKTLTSTTGLNWRGTVAKEQVLAAIGADGRGQVQFTVSAGSSSAIYGLSVQVVAASPPAITGVTIDRNPVTVAKPASKKTCAAVNQCENTTEVVFTVTVDGLDPAQDSVVLQFQLYDGTFQEQPLSPAAGVWRFTARQRTTKFLAGSARRFRFSAIRSADGATASTTVLRDVVSA